MPGAAVEKPLSQTNTCTISHTNHIHIHSSTNRQLTVKALPANKKAPHLTSKAQCGANPAVDPEAPISLYAANQICTEAVPVGTANRRLIEGGVEDYTPATCAQACRADGYIPKFYSIVKPSATGGPNQCLWCVA